MFHIKPSVLAKGKGKYCSRACAAQSSPSGAAHPRWKGGRAAWDRSGSRVAKVCEGCGVTFIAERNRVRFCSVACHHRATARRGALNPNWGGGCDKQQRKTVQYAEWRTAVFRRDGFTCQDCGVVGYNLNAHHVKPWKPYPDLRFDVANGVTLCSKCHKRRHAVEGSPRTAQ
jgi:hypothetical protein